MDRPMSPQLVDERGELPSLARGRLRLHATQEDDMDTEGHLFSAGEDGLQLATSRVDHEDEWKFIEPSIVVRELPCSHEGLPVALRFCREAWKMEIAQVRIGQEVGG